MLSYRIHKNQGSMTKKFQWTIVRFGVTQEVVLVSGETVSHEEAVEVTKRLPAGNIEERIVTELNNDSVLVGIEI